LRYLTSEDNITSISYAFQVGHNIVSKIISETYDVSFSVCLNIEFYKGYS